MYPSAKIRLTAPSGRTDNFNILNLNIMKLKNTIKISIILIITALSYNQIKAQTSVHSGNNIICTGDSLVLYAPEHRGDIQWQISTDGMLWDDIENAVTDSLGINPSNSTY